MADASAPAAEVAAEDKEDKKDKKDEFHVPLEAIAPIAAPLAGKKLSKKLFKTVKKGELDFLFPLPLPLLPALGSRPGLPRVLWELGWRFFTLSEPLGPPRKAGREPTMPVSSSSKSQTDLLPSSPLILFPARSRSHSHSFPACPHPIFRALQPPRLVSSSVELRRSSRPSAKERRVSSSSPPT